MTGNTIALVIQKRAMKAGLSVQYQGHSLRKGFVQSAHKAGVSLDAVMATTGHKSVVLTLVGIGVFVMGALFTVALIGNAITTFRTQVIEPGLERKRQREKASNE
jgi:hypothetical protein